MGLLDVPSHLSLALPSPLSGLVATEGRCHGLAYGPDALNFYPITQLFLYTFQQRRPNKTPPHTYFPSVLSPFSYSFSQLSIYFVAKTATLTSLQAYQPVGW